MEAESIYKSPRHIARSSASLSDSELRDYYAEDEVCVLAVGWFYLFFGSLLFATSSVGIAVSLLEEQITLGFISFCFFMVCFAYLLLGYGMRRFEAWARRPAHFAAIVMICIFPIGTPTGIICYYLLNRRSHEDVFSKKYHDLVAASPMLEKHHAAWIPIVGGMLSGITLALSLYLLRDTLVRALTTWL
jgi:hypothetical protein